VNVYVFARTCEEGLVMGVGMGVVYLPTCVCQLAYRSVCESTHHTHTHPSPFYHSCIHASIHLHRCTAERGCVRVRACVRAYENGLRPLTR
jgi:hypothetical protein